MTRNLLIDEKPRFDTATGRPFVLNCLEHVLVFSREYLDSDEVVALSGMRGLSELAEGSRVGSREELSDYLNERGIA